MILNVAFLVRFSFFRFLLLLLLYVYAFAFLLNERSSLTVWCSTALRDRVPCQSEHVPHQQIEPQQLTGNCARRVLP